MDSYQIIPAFVLLTVGHLADYLFQADAWGWRNPLWENGYRAPKWGWLDWIPHDPLHIAQMVRNLAWIVGVFLLSRIDFPWYWTLGTIIAVNAIARGIGFSVPLKFIAKR
jgi:hypothetical protein